MRTLIVGILLCMLAAGCAWKDYDPDHPREYSDYWNDPDNRANSPLYPFTHESRRKGDQRPGPYGP